MKRNYSRSIATRCPNHLRKCTEVSALEFLLLQNKAPILHAEIPISSAATEVNSKLFVSSVTVVSVAFDTYHLFSLSQKFATQSAYLGLHVKIHHEICLR